MSNIYKYYYGIMGILSAFSFVIAIWADQAIPGNCRDNTLRGSVRVLVVMSMIMLIINIASLVCGENCPKYNTGVSPGMAILTGASYIVLSSFAMVVRGRLTKRAVPTNNPKVMTKCISNPKTLQLWLLIVFLLNLLPGIGAIIYGIVEKRRQEAPVRAEKRKVQQGIKLTQIRRRKETTQQRTAEHEAELKRKQEIELASEEEAEARRQESEVQRELRSRPKPKTARERLQIQKTRQQVAKLEAANRRVEKAAEQVLRKTRELQDARNPAQRANKRRKNIVKRAEAKLNGAEKELQKAEEVLERLEGKNYRFAGFRE